MKYNISLVVKNIVEGKQFSLKESVSKRINTILAPMIEEKFVKVANESKQLKENKRENYFNFLNGIQKHISEDHSLQRITTGKTRSLPGHFSNLADKKEPKNAFKKMYKRQAAAQQTYSKDFMKYDTQNNTSKQGLNTAKVHQSSQTGDIRKSIGKSIARNKAKGSK